MFLDGFIVGPPPGDLVALLVEREALGEFSVSLREAHEPSENLRGCFSGRDPVQGLLPLPGVTSKLCERCLRVLPVHAKNPPPVRRVLQVPGKPQVYTIILFRELYHSNLL